MKTILFIDFLPMSGSCTGLLTVIKYLNKHNKFRAIVIGSPNSILHEASEELGYLYYAFNAPKESELRNNPINFIKEYVRALSKICRIVLKHKPDIIHCNHYMWSIYANPVGFIFNTQVFIHLKDVWALKTKWARVLMKFNPKTLYIAVSKYVFNKFVYSYKVNIRKTILIYDGIDNEIFRLSSLKDLKLKQLKKGKSFVYFSRVAIERDIEIYIETAALLLVKHPDFTFYHYGYYKNHTDHNYFISLKSRVKALNIQHRFKFYRYIEDSNQVAKILQQSYLTLIPARSFALPNTAIESMMCGTPVVAFNTGGNPEIISNSQLGILLDVNSPLLYVKVIEFYLKNKQKYIEAAINGAKYSTGIFTADIQIQKLIDLYNTPK